MFLTYIPLMRTWTTMHWELLIVSFKNFPSQCAQGRSRNVPGNGHPQVYWLCIWHSLRMNAKLVARAWANLGSLIVGVTIILRSIIYDFHEPFLKFTQKLGKNSEIPLCTYFSFSFQPTVHNGRVRRPFLNDLQKEYCVMIKLIALDWQWVTLISWCQINRLGHTSPVMHKIVGKTHDIFTN